jgi:hypothetical protein
MPASPLLDQPLILNVSTTHTTISKALIQEKEVCKEGRKSSQHVPIYFVSEALAGSKKYYLEIEKICYVVHECKKALSLFRSSQSQSPNESAAE